MDSSGLPPTKSSGFRGFDSSKLLIIRGSPGKLDSRTLSRKTLSRWTGRSGLPPSCSQMENDKLFIKHYKTPTTTTTTATTTTTTTTTTITSNNNDRTITKYSCQFGPKETRVQAYSQMAVLRVVR